MTERYLVVLDAGATSVRCYVFDQRAGTVSAGATAWRYLDVQDASPFAREFDTAPLWDDICRLIARTLGDSGAAPHQVAAITATSQRQGVVFLDAGGSEIYAGPNLDLRAVFEGAAIDRQFRRRVYRITGHLPSFLFAPARLRWFQEHRPEAYNSIAAVLPLADWLVFRLSGALASEYTLAGEVGLLDIHRRNWCNGLLDEMGLPDNTQVPLVISGTRVGGLRRPVASAIGLAVGTPVVAAGADTQCGLLGLGLTDRRQVGIVAGWSVPLQMVTDRPILDPGARTWTGCFLRPEAWTLESTSGDSGNSYRWLADTLWGSGQDAYSEMDEAAGKVPAGSEGVLALLGPSRMDMSRPGLRTGGILFPVPLTFGKTGKGHVARAALEAIAYAVKANLEQLERVAAMQATTVAVGGGMTRTSTFVEVLANVLGRDVHVSLAPHVSALGAYLCAATATGQYASLDEAADSVTAQRRTAEHDPLLSSEYQDHYQRWMDAMSHLDGLSP